MNLKRQASPPRCMHDWYSTSAVKAHRGRVMRKMLAASLADLVKMAGRLGA